MVLTPVYAHHRDSMLSDESTDAPDYDLDRQPKLSEASIHPHKLSSGANSVRFSLLGSIRGSELQRLDSDSSGSYRALTKLPEIPRPSWMDVEIKTESYYDNRATAGKPSNTALRNLPQPDKSYLHKREETYVNRNLNKSASRIHIFDRSGSEESSRARHRRSYSYEDYYPVRLRERPPIRKYRYADALVDTPIVLRSVSKRDTTSIRRSESDRRLYSRDIRGRPMRLRSARSNYGQPYKFKILPSPRVSNGPRSDEYDDYYDHYSSSRSMRPAKTDSRSRSAKLSDVKLRVNDSRGHSRDTTTIKLRASGDSSRNAKTIKLRANGNDLRNYIERGDIRVTRLLPEYITSDSNVGSTSDSGVSDQVSTTYHFRKHCSPIKTEPLATSSARLS